MRKEERDRIMMGMGQEERNDFRRILQKFRSELKASSGQRVTARQILEALGDEVSPGLRAPLEAVMARDETGPRVGEEAPDFFLKRMGSEERVRLSSFKGKRPVAIAFGSYT